MLFAPLTRPSWILADLLQVLVILIFIDVIRSWLYVSGVRNTSDHAPWVRRLHSVINPVLKPFRALWDAIVSGLGRSFRMNTWTLRRFDLSPMLALIVIWIVQGILTRT